jgi:hypothetical protein
MNSLRSAGWLGLVSLAAFWLLSLPMPELDAADAPEQHLPPGWLKAWRDPPLEDRPLQIVHGIPAERASVEGMRYYRDLGLGGVVCNVAFHRYLQSEENWRTLVQAVEACRTLGLVVWLYDEEGYPSGAAGGLVLAKDRAFEATELAYDPRRDDPFVLRPAYEYAHASNNYHAARRYVNLLDDRAVATFIELTHDAYWKRLQKYFGRTIQAAFTDEPSLMAVNLGQIPEPARRNVRVVDPLDAQAPSLPTVPWSRDLAEKYRQRYGADLLAQRRSLFTGTTDADRRVRRQYWALVAELVTDRYFGALHRWCSAHGIASSGHTLHEESILHQVPLEGNGLQALSTMDIPGLDLLTSDPAAVVHGGWLTAALPSSAALLMGRRRVMTEVSDFSQTMSGSGPASLALMQATAAWQAAWGVTEFTLYYRYDNRPAGVYRAYCDYIGRLNAILKSAALHRPILLYYPIRDLWAEYVPQAGPLHLASQSDRARRIVESFNRLGRSLQRAQIPFALIDHQHLAAATVQPGGRLNAGSGTFDAVLLPDGADFPPEAQSTVRAVGVPPVRVVRDETKTPGPTKDALRLWFRPAHRIVPDSDQIACGEFTRDGRTILLLVNVGREPYRGRLQTDMAGPWCVLNPATGDIRGVVRDEKSGVELTLAPHEATLLISH